MDTPIYDEGTLREMPYSELKRTAKSLGLKGNVKAEILIAKLLSISAEDMESSSQVQREINSSRQDKESKVDGETPRRGTYSVERKDLLNYPVPCDSLSSMTSGKKSQRKLRSTKVSFVSPVKLTPKQSRSQKYMSLKDRPKTPTASSKQMQTKPLALTPITLNTKKFEFMEGLGNSVLKENTAPKSKRKATPNFQKIHQKAFDKMESIDDFQMRKLKGLTKKSEQKAKARSKIPVAFSGIPFIPTVTSCSDIKLNFSSSMPKSIPHKERPSGKTTAPSGNRRTKFDLQASLSRKLSYKPYKGPLKPLSDSIYSNHTEDPFSVVVTRKRLQSKTLLQGVRTNKRFELQMKNRKIE